MSRSRGVLLRRSDASLLVEKVILVTGAGRGIGRAIALDAASRGARLVLNDLDEALISELATQIGSSILSKQLKLLLSLCFLLCSSLAMKA